MAMATTKPKRRSPRSKKPPQVDSASVPPQFAGIRVVREIRSGYGTYEIVNAVNDMLQRGWILLGAQFVTSSSLSVEQREFLYVLGSTDPTLAGASSVDAEFDELQESLRRWSSET